MATQKLPDGSVHEERRSPQWKPMIMVGTQPILGELTEVWENDRYHANVVRYSNDWPIGGGPWARIGITHNSQRAVHDWRDLQQAKNDIVGEEWEAVELYPAESRLLDPSNRFYLWCAPAINVGRFIGRQVLSHKEAKAPQRPFARNDRCES